MISALATYLAAINVVAFFFYGIDKWKSKRNKWRISESTLIGLAAAGGALGAWLGMQTFRHKTKHNKFKILVPAFLIIWIVGFGYLYSEFCS